ncbi:MAG: glycosyltransferase family 2 protein [Lachnospiraceae bacterium]|nr:glycosyltransferase family 2 protein [Lachnospiraceae bacterium]
MTEIVFIILQYGRFEETKKCIESLIEKVDTDSFAIIVVDNCSPDGAYEQTRRAFEVISDDRFFLLKNETNLGFANGNNVGIAFARSELGAQFVAVINNDTELISNDLCSKLRAKYKETDFAVAGPLVLSGDGKYVSNPMGMKLFEEQEIEHEIRHSKRMLRLNQYGLIKIYNAYKSISRKPSTEQRYHSVHKDCFDVKLHGCFLVFSPTFFEKLQGFNGKTFLYMEEDILLLELLKNNMHSLYTPEICIFHKEGATTQEIKGRKKINFIYSNRLRSQEIYRELLLKMKERTEHM